jgi:hypothetical protein
MPYGVCKARLSAIGGSKDFYVWHWQNNSVSRLDHPDLRAASKDFGLIVVDTLRRFMPGLQENSASDMAIITDNMRKLTKWGATIVANHHSIKNIPTSHDSAPNGIYRGSSELGAGVDIAFSLDKRKIDGQEIIHLTVSKTRYADELERKLRVIRTPNRPVFSDVTRELIVKEQDEQSVMMQQLSAVIATVAHERGREPNQLEISEKAIAIGLARTRKTVRAYLEKGNGKFWNGTPRGRSVTYRAIGSLDI